MGVMTRRYRVLTLGSDGTERRPDAVAVEAPLTLVVNRVVVATTMRTPGNDLELAAGWLVAEVGVRSAADIVRLRAATATHPLPTRMIRFTSRWLDTSRRRYRDSRSRTHRAASAAPAASRTFRARRFARHRTVWQVSTPVLLGIPDRMRERQRAFNRTGGTHGAAVVASDGRILVMREDVGRHNAVDTVVGERLLAGELPLTGRLLTVTGRVSYEIVQKGVAAGVAGIVAVSAPASSAIDLARRHGLLLAGIARGTRLNVYAGEDLLLPATVGTSERSPSPPA